MDAFIGRAKKKIKPERAPKKKSGKKRRAGVAAEVIVPGTLYIGHLPHGFYELQLRKYFSQFGKIKKLRVSRSRKTGGCKGYAYIQFEMEEVAKIVAETMNNYMFFEKLLKCSFIPADRLHPNTFKGWRKQMSLSSTKKMKKHNCKKSEENVNKSNLRRIVRVKKLKSALKDKGVQFKFEHLLCQQWRVDNPKDEKQSPLMREYVCSVMEQHQPREKEVPMSRSRVSGAVVPIALRDG